MKKIYTLKKHIHGEDMYIEKIYTWKRHGGDTMRAYTQKKIHTERTYIQRGYIHRKDIYTEGKI